MKKCIILSIVILAALPTFGQRFLTPDTTVELYSKDSEIKVFEENPLNNTSHNDDIAFYINDILVSETIFRQLDPLKIESVNVVKEKLQHNGISYDARIYIKTKNDFKPEIISLGDLAKKYLTINSEILVFQIDDKVINQDYTDYIIDENFILKIVKSKIKSPNNTDIALIKIITKTDENIEKANQVKVILR